MNKVITLFALVLIAFSGFASDSSNVEQAPQENILVYKYSINQEIAPAAWRKTKKAIQESKEMNATHFLLVLDTYGGQVDMADSIRTAILNLTIPTFVYIENNAASAGALISIACEKIYMHKAAKIGAATVVNQTGEVVPDKYQSYMRATMRSTAEARGRNPIIAEAMVDPSITIAGVIDSGKVLTFTTSEAIKNGFCDGIASSITEVLEKEGLAEAKIYAQTPDSMDGIIDFLINPAVSSVLILIIMGGIYFELQTPGVGFPILAAAIAAILYFAPLYLEGLADNWEILLFVSGLILIAVEIFVIPGFGVAGILGIIFTVSGLALSMVWNDYFDFEVQGNGTSLIQAFMIVLLSILGATILSFILGKSLLKSPMFQRLVLQDQQNAKDGYVVKEETTSTWIGMQGITTTVLRPGGKIEIDGKRYDAISEDGYIEKDQKVRVIKEESTTLIVLKA